MAGSAVIGALRVVLGADTAALETGLKRAQSDLASFGAGVERAMKVAAGAMVLGLGAIGVALKGAVDEADKMGKMAQSVGIPVEELSKLKHAADLSGVGIDNLGVAMGNLARNMAEAAKNPMSEAAMAFKAVGVSATQADGSLKPLTQITTELAGRFAGFEDGAGKTALAMALLGKSGASIIPMLNAGASGLREMMAEAEQLGLVIDNKTAKGAEAFNDNLTRMGKIGSGIMLQVLAPMAPMMASLSQAMLDAAKNTGLMSDISTTMTAIFKGVVEAVLTGITAFQRLGAEASALWRVLMAPDLASMKQAWADFQSAGTQTAIAMGQIGSTMSDFWRKTTDDAAKAAGDTQQKVAAPLIQSAEKAQNSVEAFLSSQMKRTAAMNADAESVGMSIGAQQRLRIEYEAQTLALEKNIPLTTALSQKIAEAANAAALAAQRVAAARVTQEVMTPAEQFAQQMEQQRMLYEAGAVSAETYGRKTRQIAEQAGADWGTAGASIAGSFASIAQSFGKESSTMAKAAKIFGAISATISMFTGAAKALELPFPANLAAMATVLAKGAALVASIKSQSVPGFKTGLSMRVPGGIGGGDSKLFQAMVEPGEQIDITPNSASGSHANNGGGGVVRVEGLRPDALYTYDHIRSLLENIGKFVGDGGESPFVIATAN